MNIKLHAVADANGRPLSFFMTAGQVSDYTGAAAAGRSSQGAVDAGRPRLRRRLVLGRSSGKGHHTLHSGTAIPDHACQIRQPPIQKLQPHQDDGWPPQGLARGRHPLRSAPDRLGLRDRPRRHRHLLAVINESSPKRLPHRG